MALINVKNTNPIIKKVSLDEVVDKELQEYIKFLGLEETKDAESLVINQALDYIFKKDKDYKSYKKLNSLSPEAQQKMLE